MRKTDEKQETCISYYQLSRILGTPYKTTRNLIHAGLRSLGCTTHSGAPGIHETEFKHFQENFKVVQTVNGYWKLIPVAQQTLPGFFREIING